MMVNSSHRAGDKENHLQSRLLSSSEQSFREDVSRASQIQYGDRSTVCSQQPAQSENRQIGCLAASAKQFTQRSCGHRSAYHRHTDDQRRNAFTTLNAPICSAVSEAQDHIEGMKSNSVFGWKIKLRNDFRFGLIAANKTPRTIK
jgi:hypothetical protein